MTRLIRCVDQIFVKAELDNPGCSHKFRAAQYIIEHAIKAGKIIAGKTTIIEKTGGNFGFGLLAASSTYGVDVDLAVGLSFSKRKRDLLEFLGARLIGKEMLVSGMTPKDVVQYHLDHQKLLGKDYFYTDQFQNQMGVEAHRQLTGAELASQLRQEGISDAVIFVGCAGTGASFTGISLALREAGFDVTAILVEPVGCDMRTGQFSEHRIEGASVGVPAPFLDWNLIKDVHVVYPNEVLTTQRWFYFQTGLFVGNSSAATIAIAQKIKSDNRYKNTPVVTIAYDSGLWYDDFMAVTLASSQKTDHCDSQFAARLHQNED